MKNKKSIKILEDVKLNVKLKLSGLWVTLMMLYIYKDFFDSYVPGELENMLAGRMGPFQVTQGALLSASILMAIPAIMIFLSLVLKPKLNRNLNIILCIFFLIVEILSAIGETWIHYIFFEVVEVTIMILILWHALKWPKQEA